MAFNSKKLQASTSAPPIEDFQPVEGNLVEEIPFDDNQVKNAISQLDFEQNALTLGHAKNLETLYSTYSGRLVDFRNPRPIEYPNFFTGNIILDKESKNLGMVDDNGKIVSVPISIKVVGNAELDILKELQNSDVLLKGVWIHNTYGATLDLSKHGFITYPQLKADTIDWKGFIKLATIAKLPTVGKRRLERLKETLSNVKEAIAYLAGEKDKNGSYKLAEIFHDLPFEQIPVIITAWNVFVSTQKDVLFLLSIGLSQDNANSWVEKHKDHLDDARKTLKTNPWSLVELDGVGFKKADEIALGLGFEDNHPKRLREALIYGANEACFQSGNTQILEHEWLSKTIQLLKIASHQTEILESLKEIRDKITSEEEFVKKVPNSNRISPIVFYKAEARLSLYIADKLKNGKPIVTMDKLPLAIKYIAEAQMLTGRGLDDSQLNAVLIALTSPIAVMTGGPGAGKTTTLQVLTYVAQKMGKTLNLAAPTGRAAKRMNDQIKQILPNEVASTLHRTLKFNQGSFTHNEYAPMGENTFVVDESSMIDAELACDYIKSIPQSGTVLFVGDANQLPSVSPGAVLNDIIESGCVPVASLDGNHRSKDVTSILDSAKRILSGMAPNHKGMIDKDGYSQVSVKTDNTTKNVNRVAAETLIETTKHLLNTGILPDQIQVIMPMHGSNVFDLDQDDGNPFGTVTLNKLLRPYFNKNAKLIESGAYLDLPDGETDRKDDFYIGDRVMVTKNCYKAVMPSKTKKPNEEEDLSLFNGDMGIIKRIVLTEPKSNAIIREKEMAAQGIISPSVLTNVDEGSAEESYVEFDMEDGRSVKVVFGKLKDLKLKLGYVITIHKSQGSERDVVVIGMGDSQRVMLNRNLIYTAITRAKKRAIVITQGRAMDMTIKTLGNKRETGLASFIRTSMKLSKPKLDLWVKEKGLLNTVKKVAEPTEIIKKEKTNNKSHHFNKTI